MRRKREPNSPCWRNGLPFFLAGGGSGHRIYVDALSAAHASLSQACQIGGFVRRRLLKPRSLATEGIDERALTFLSVAFGLSHDTFDIGEIQPPSDIEDLRRSRRTGTGNAFVDKDQV